jgi:hypothetical protein
MCRVIGQQSESAFVETRPVLDVSGAIHATEGDSLPPYQAEAEISASRLNVKDTEQREIQEKY